MTSRAVAADTDPARLRVLVDSPDSLRAQRGRYEELWNDLFAVELEAAATEAGNARSLRRLEEGLAAAERRTLGSDIAARALTLRKGWGPRDARDRARAWHDETLGWSPALRAEPARAESLIAAALATYERLGDRRRQAWAAGRLGGLVMSREDYPRAYALQQRTLELRRAWGDSAMVGNTLNDLGGIALNLGRIDEAVPYLEEARAIRERRADPRLASTLDRLGAAYERLGRDDAADAAFRAALAAPSTPASRIDMLLNYGERLRRAGRLSAAGDTLDRALALVAETGDDTKLGAALDRLSNVAADAGRFSDCIELQYRCTALAEASRDTVALAQALARRGNAWLGARRITEARRDLERARTFASALGDSALQGRCLAELALVAQLDGDTTLALRLTGDALQCAEATQDRALQHDARAQLGLIEFECGRFADALDSFERTLALVGQRNGSQGLGDRLNVAAAKVRLGRHDQAEAELLEVARLADERGLLRVAPEARTDLAHIAWARGDTARALAMSRENLEQVERLRALQRTEDPLLGLFADHADEFDSMLQFLVRGGTRPGLPDPGAEAFAWAERARGRVLLDLLAARRGTAVAPRLLGLADVQARLAPDEALLEYALGDSLGVAWVVRRDAFSWVELPDRRHLRARVELARAVVSDLRSPRLGREPAILGTLGELLVGRLAPALAGARHLIVVPDGPLCYLPFECLRLGDRYLVESCTVAYAPSASVRLGPPCPPAESLVVALGAPSFVASPELVASEAGPSTGVLRGLELEPLPYSAFEVEALRRLAPPRPVVALTGAHATRRELLAVPGLARAAVVHLATHGQADDLEPERSSLWFAPDSAGGAPGQLTAREVASLDLGADLVTLAACESGLGRYERGEGVLGFSRAFLAAGAHSVVASLWKVSDRASARLMQEFYAALLERGTSRAEALARAKRALIASPATHRPFYWAAFVLVGEDGPLGRRGAPSQPSPR